MLEFVKVFVPLLIFALSSVFGVFGEWKARQRKQLNARKVLGVHLQDTAEWVHKVSPPPNPTRPDLEAAAYVYAHYLDPLSFESSLNLVAELEVDTVETAERALAALRFAQITARRYLEELARDGATAPTAFLFCQLCRDCEQKTDRAVAVLNHRPDPGETQHVFER
jgi:hypothetical protein